MCAICTISPAHGVYHEFKKCQRVVCTGEQRTSCPSTYVTAHQCAVFVGTQCTASCSVHQCRVFWCRVRRSVVSASAVNACAQCATVCSVRRRTAFGGMRRGGIWHCGPPLIALPGCLKIGEKKKTKTNYENTHLHTAKKHACVRLNTCAVCNLHLFRNLTHARVHVFAYMRTKS